MSMWIRGKRYLYPSSPLSMSPSHTYNQHHHQRQRQHTHTHIHIRIHTHSPTSSHTHTFTHTHAFTHSHSHTRSLPLTHTHTPRLLTLIHTHSPTLTHTHKPPDLDPPSLPSLHPDSAVSYGPFCCNNMAWLVPTLRARKAAMEAPRAHGHLQHPHCPAHERKGMHMGRGRFASSWIKRGTKRQTFRLKPTANNAMACEPQVEASP